MHLLLVLLFASLLFRLLSVPDCSSSSAFGLKLELLLQVSCVFNAARLLIVAAISFLALLTLTIFLRLRLLLFHFDCKLQPRAEDSQPTVLLFASDSSLSVPSTVVTFLARLSCCKLLPDEPCDPPQKQNEEEEEV